MYSLFAKYYDAFTENADYAARADYLSELIEKYGKGKGILLDLACGTGTLSFEMEKRGFDVIGTDISAEMLDEALEKKLQTDSHIIFLNQDMCELDLFGTITACICTLDSVNHIESARKLKAAFSKVSLFSEAGSVFIFDVNTEYKHREVLGDNAYIYENDTCFLAWQNEVNEDASVNIYLDFFEKQGETYRRESEFITEYYYSDEVLTNLLNETGFELAGIFDDFSFEAPGETSERKIFVAIKR